MYDLRRLRFESGFLGNYSEKVLSNPSGQVYLQLVLFRNIHALIPTPH
jgi:hypothetical protein